uniref:Uncharacterized protein n=1 Tax=Lepeophtheirus salmonis TaxID=72036 RepID=A0A0K2UL10_LEPSM
MKLRSRGSLKMIREQIQEQISLRRPQKERKLSRGQLLLNVYKNMGPPSSPDLNPLDYSI